MSDDLNSKTIEYQTNQDINKFENKPNNFLSTIDYNYPSLNRKDLLDLNRINDKSRYFKKLNTNRDWSLNLYNLDIEGSSPRKFGYFFDKEDFTNKNSDIEKSSPKNYNQNINKQSFNLTNDDIEFSKPQCVKNATSRHTNPLEPKYKIDNPPILPIPPPKFIRDSMEINDIQGTRPKKIGNEKNLFKEPIKKDIIKDSWPRRPYIRKSKYEFLDYRDVTNQKINYRNTNPLRPIYNWSYADNTKSFGPIDGNYPLVYSKYLYKTPFILNNKDIEGSNTGSKNRILKYKSKNFSYSTKDIKGAQSDTVIRGIITNRHINPISPQYKYLGHSEIVNLDNNPYNTGFKSTAHYNKVRKIKYNINNNNNLSYNKNSIKNYIEDSLNNYNELDINKDDKNKLLEKTIKIVENKNDNNKIKDEFNTFIGNEGKPDFENYSPSNDRVDFDKNKYKKPEVFYGLSHNQYLLPADLNSNEKMNKSKFEKLKIPLNPINRKEMKKRSVSTISEDNNYCSKLDDFMNKKNFKYIEKPSKIEDKNDIDINRALILNKSNKNIDNNNI